MSDDKLRALYGLGVRQRATTDRTSCVSPDRIRAAIEHRGTQTERHGTLDHVASCPFCREDYNLLRSVSDAPARRREIPRRVVFAGGTLLAAAAAVALLVRGDPPRPGPEPDVPRGAGRALLPISPRGVVPAGEPVVLRWRAVEGAVDYDAELLREDGALVAALRSRDTVLALPDSLTASGGDFRWWVRARLTDGSRLSSEPLTFRRGAR